MKQKANGTPAAGLSNRLLTLLAALLFLAGGILVLYPSAASWFAQYNQSKVVAQGVPDPDRVKAADQAVQLAAAERYNGLLQSGASYKAGGNLPTSQAGSSLHDAYAGVLDAGRGLMGRLQIPSIDVDLPVYHGTSDDTLLKGAGHLEGTSLPVGGAGTHAVITAHRGLAKATMFTNLDRMGRGDRFTFSTFGRVMTYEVVQVQVVDPDQTRGLGPVEGEDLMTLVACTPLGINSQRIFVTGRRVVPTPDDDRKAASQVSDLPHFPWWALILTTLVSALAARICLAFQPGQEVRRHCTDRKLRT